MNDTFIKAIQEANTVLLTDPSCIELVHDKNSLSWGDASSSAKKARVRIRQILNELWQAGAYNYEQIARSLRVDTRTVQALIDEQFISAKGL